MSVSQIKNKKNEAFTENTYNSKIKFIKCKTWDWVCKKQSWEVQIDQITWK